MKPLPYFLISCLLIISCNNNKPTVKLNPVIVPENLPLKSVNYKVLIGGLNGNDKHDDQTLAVGLKEFNCGQSLWYAGFGGWKAEKEFDFKDVNMGINLFLDHKISPHIHMLVGPDNYMPEWLTKGEWTPTQLDELLKSEIFAIMSSNNNAEKVDIWNITNELFEEDGSYRGNMVWNKMGWEDDQSGLTGGENINKKHPIF